MAHNLEEKNGSVAFASLREPAWHGLGTVFEEEVTTNEMLDLSHLSKWNVRLEDVILPDNYTTVKNNFMVVRDNPFEENITDVLGIVGDRYNVVQNEDLFSFGDSILDGGGIWETAGSIKKGTVVFGTLSLDKEIVLDPQGANDKTKTYLLLHTSHDGSISIQASITPVRVVCQNTLNLAIRSHKQSFKIRHTQSADGKVAQAREALGITFAYMDKFEQEAKSLYQTSMTEAEFINIVKDIYPKPEKDTKGNFKKWETKMETLQEILISPTNTNIFGTAWAGLNTLTERLDWYRTARGGNSENQLASASGFDPVINSEKNKIFSIVKQFAKDKNPKAFV
jgi:phage/plasmid-like protein (TIGR03299 family)